MEKGNQNRKVYKGVNTVKWYNSLLYDNKKVRFIIKMGNENIEVKNLEGLKDLDSFKEGDTVKMEIGGNTSLKVCYRPLKGVSYPNGKLKFLNPASMTEDVVISLYVPRESVLVKDNMIKVINPKDITLMLSYRNDPLDSGMSYMNKVDTIRKAGF